MSKDSVVDVVPQHVIFAAHTLADQTARQAGVVMTELRTPQQCATAAELLDCIWNDDSGGAAPVEPGLLIALGHAGNYVAGAYLDQQMVGVTAGFFGAPAAGRMHSHIAGVSASAKGKGVGTAMKLHQRAWCLQRGVTTLEWTFDPLILRNAGFNLNRLGAQLEEYLPNFYGTMRDATNSGHGSDRALIRWHLGRPVRPLGDALESASRIVRHLDIGEDGAPVRTSEDLRTVAEGMVGLRVPRDIEGMRAQCSTVSVQWRQALRETMYPLMEAGWQIRGILRDGTYVLQR
ncbi:hypothetical protein [Nesterenkonia populi]|uniref:hypothetical protein n=1 Tax=Nesterenkonia populi TaxID=1591087 RepID=UPI0011BFB2DF|nr:hypothetical protein [Nesterenkonia populi]